MSGSLEPAIRTSQTDLLRTPGPFLNPCCGTDLKSVLPSLRRQIVPYSHYDRQTSPNFSSKFWRILRKVYVRTPFGRRSEAPDPSTSVALRRRRATHFPGSAGSSPSRLESQRRLPSPIQPSVASSLAWAFTGHQRYTRKASSWIWRLFVSMKGFPNTKMHSPRK
jgi:hypothetical protein